VDGGLVGLCIGGGGGVQEPRTTSWRRTSPLVFQIGDATVFVDPRDDRDDGGDDIIAGMSLRGDTWTPLTSKYRCEHPAFNGTTIACGVSLVMIDADAAEARGRSSIAIEPYPVWVLAETRQEARITELPKMRQPDC